MILLYQVTSMNYCVQRSEKIKILLMLKNIYTTYDTLFSVSVLFWIIVIMIELDCICNKPCIVVGTSAMLELYHHCL